MRTAIVAGVMAALIGVVLIAGAGDVGGPNSAVVIGLTSGTVYGLVALGLVLVYKGARVFNFAQAEFGTVAGFIVFVLAEQVTSPNIPYGVAVVIALAGMTLVGLGVERVMVRPLMNSPRALLLVGTIALTLLMIGVELLLFHPEPKELKPVLATTDAGGNPLGPTIFDYAVEPQRLLAIAVLIVLGAALAYFFSKTDMGLAVLATSQDSFATRVMGVGVNRVSRFIWGTSAFLGALAGILLIPLTPPLIPSAMTQVTLIPAFTAAVIGGMTSLSGAFLGGIAVGTIQSLTFWASGHYHIGDQAIDQFVPGSPTVGLFLILLVILLTRPQGLLGTEA